MSQQGHRYCLDANVLINAWNQYYHRDFCPDYWTELKRFGFEQRVFLCEAVRDEITRSDDLLAAWVQASGIPVYEVDGNVTQIVQRIFTHDSRHEFLVDASKQRSMADPWVIAHAIDQQATVVTKENKEIQSPTKVKIPNVCENMGVRWIDDFTMIRELRLRFTCAVHQQ